MFIKYADDTAILWKINKKEDCSYINQDVDTFVNWCESNYLSLNVSKTKDMIIDFGRPKKEFEEIIINGSKVEQVGNYKYLGTVIGERLEWTMNTSATCNKAWKRMYYLRKLKEFNINPAIMRLFYDSVVTSVLMFNAVAWFNNISLELKKKLEKVSKSADRIIGTNAKNTLDDQCKRQVLNLSRRVISNPVHPLHNS